MGRIVVTGVDDVSVPWQPSINSGLNSRQITTAGTVITLNDFEYAALSSTAFSSGSLVDAGDENGVGGVGTVVERATDTLPQTGTENLFTIAGGRILLTGLYGEVTTVIGATASTVTVIHDPTAAGASQTIGAASASIANAAVGSILSLEEVVTSTQASALTVISHLNFGHMAAVSKLLKPGAIGITTSGSTSGSVKWTATYIPFDLGATLTATALS